MSLLQIYQWVWQWKNCENRLIFGEVTGKSLVSCFFWDTVYSGNNVLQVSFYNIDCRVQIQLLDELPHTDTHTDRHTHVRSSQYSAPLQAHGTGGGITMLVPQRSYGPARNLPNTKQQSHCKIAFISQNFSLNLFLSTCQRINCKQYVRSCLGCLNGSEPIHWANAFFCFSTSGRLWTTLIFSLFWHA